MNAQEITAMTYQKDDVLVRSGKRAVVIEPAIHRVSKKFIGYVVWLHTDGKPMPQQCTLFVADLRDNWTLKPAAEAAPVEELPDADCAERLNGEEAMILLAANEVYLTDWRDNDDDEKTAGWRHAGYFTEVNVTHDYSKLVSLGLMESNGNTEHTPSYRITPKGMKVAKVLSASPAADPDLTATAARIQQLQKDLSDANSLIESLENRVEKLTEERDEAIDELSRANDRADDVRDDRTGELEDARFEIQRLTEVLAKSRAEAAPILNAPASDVLTAPKQQIHTLFQLVSGGSERRAAMDDELADHLNDGWQLFHCGLDSSDEHTYRIVTLIRTCKPEPTQPRKTVTAVGPHITIQPVERIPVTERAEQEFADVLAYGKQVYENALAASPISVRPLSLIPGVQS